MQIFRLLNIAWVLVGGFGVFRLGIIPWGFPMCSLPFLPLCIRFYGGIDYTLGSRFFPVVLESRRILGWVSVWISWKTVSIWRFFSWSWFWIMCWVGVLVNRRVGIFGVGPVCCVCLLFLLSVFFSYGATRAFFPFLFAFFLLFIVKCSGNLGWELGNCQGGCDSTWCGSCR